LKDHLRNRGIAKLNGMTLLLHLVCFLVPCKCHLSVYVWSYVSSKQLSTADKLASFDRVSHTGLCPPPDDVKAKLKDMLGCLDEKFDLFDKVPVKTEVGIKREREDIDGSTIKQEPGAPLAFACTQGTESSPEVYTAGGS